MIISDLIVHLSIIVIASILSGAAFCEAEGAAISFFSFLPFPNAFIGNPALSYFDLKIWIPAYAGMTSTIARTEAAKQSQRGIASLFAMTANPNFPIPTPLSPFSLSKTPQLLAFCLPRFEAQECLVRRCQLQLLKSRNQIL